MITFLPFEDFLASARCLDSARLGKQRGEVKAILTSIYWNVLRGNIFLAERAGVDLLKFGYNKLGEHPAKVMWEEWPLALVAYGVAVCEEWTSRGNRDGTRSQIEAFADLDPDNYPDYEWLRENAPDLLPDWLGDPRLHASHKSKLIKKMPTHYRVGLGWEEPDDLDYFWPGRDYEKP